MSEPALSLNLGNGLYMDSEGELHRVRRSTCQSTRHPKLPVDAQKISSAVSEVKSRLPTSTKRDFCTTNGERSMRSTRCSIF